MNPKSDLIVPLRKGLRLKYAADAGLWRIESLERDPTGRRPDGFLWLGFMAHDDLQFLLELAKLRGLIDAQQLGLIDLHCRHRVDPGAIT